VELLQKLNEIGGKHAIGQIDIVENRLVGMKSRGVYETPGGSILYAAHDNLEQLVLDKETYHLKQQLAHKYAEFVYNGQWFTPAREALDAFVNKTQENMDGTARLKLYKGNIVPAGTKSPHSLYLEDLASFTNSELYDQKDAAGFIRCFGLPLKAARLKNKR
jgi:argininosuccinate synthase